MSLSGAPLCKDSGLYRMRRAGKAFFCIEEGKQNFFEKRKFSAAVSEINVKLKFKKTVILRGRTKR